MHLSLSITGYNIQSKLHGVSNLHITSLLLCNGYLWIGTSVGTIMVYRTLYIKTVPITTGKPYLALHSHASGVRVLISTHTVGTLSSSRLDQFISEEQERFQEDWETSETTEDSQVPPPTPSDSDIISVNGGGGGASSTNSTLTTASDTSTFPPLPPPLFPDETSLTGTLQSVAEPQQEQLVPQLMTRMTLHSMKRMKTFLLRHRLLKMVTIIRPKLQCLLLPPLQRTL